MLKDHDHAPPPWNMFNPVEWGDKEIQGPKSTVSELDMVVMQTMFEDSKEQDILSICIEIFFIQICDLGESGYKYKSEKY